MSSITSTRTIEVVTCGVCGVLFGLEASYHASRRRDGKRFHCPNGCVVSWNGDRKQLERKLEAAQREIQQTRESRDQQARARVAAEHSLRTTRGHLTRQKKRIAAGCCPCCSRTFQNLRRHIASQHPEYIDGGLEA